MTTIFKALENTEKGKYRHGIKSSITHPHRDNPTDTWHCVYTYVRNNVLFRYFSATFVTRLLIRHISLN